MIRLIALLVCIVGAAFLFLSHSKKGKAEVPSHKTDTLSNVEADLPVFHTDDPEWNQLFDQYSEFIQHAIDMNLAPGAAVAIVKDSSIIFLKGFGYRNTSTKDLVDTRTVFRLGSVSKCFASVLSGVLVQENIFSFDDPVIRYTPAFALKSKEQTDGLLVKHLLSHTTGLPYHSFTNLIEEGSSLDTMVYHLRDLNLLGKPGQLYSYQNVAYSIIGQVIQSATGKSYEEMMQEKIFTPLHMTHASLNYKTLMAEKNAARPHRYSPMDGSLNLAILLTTT